MIELLLSIVRRIHSPLHKAPHSERGAASIAKIRFSSRRRRRLNWIGQVCRNSR